MRGSVNAPGARSDGLSIAFKMHLGNGRTGHRKARKGPAPKPKPKPAGRVPRVARLLALAHHFDELLRQGVVKDQAEIARLMKVTRARVTQIMNLLYVAPDIQEEILFVVVEPGDGHPVSPRRIRHVIAEADWSKQRELWRVLRAR